ncbi:MAG: hypothetical protein KAT25_05680 [Sulfuriflexus sp.]|nr:hypothetical protein [Sulfuriflexus sp.]
MLTAFIASVIYALTTLIYQPELTEIDEKISVVEQKLKEVDQKLLQRNRYEKDIRRYNDNVGLKSKLGQINESFNDILIRLLEISRTSNPLISIQTDEKSTLVITIQAMNPSLLYSLVEKIEKHPVVDRVTITNISDDKQIILSLFLVNSIGGIE